MTSGRQIALLGSINRDTIRTPDGIETQSYGGLLYTILPLATIASSGTVVFPVYDVGCDVEAAVRRILDDYPAVSLEGLHFGPQANPHCILEYAADGTKQETLLETGSALSLDRLAAYADVDALLLNFVTGFELEHSTLSAFRDISGAAIFMDVHSLTLGIDAERRRFWKRPDDWEVWTSSADVVQMNRQEATLLAGRDLVTDGDWLSFAEQVLATGPGCCVVTVAEQGSVAWFTEDGRTTVDAVEAMPNGVPVDPTGCGDAFLAGFAWRYLETGDYREANRFANRLAGIAVSVRGIEGMKMIAQRLKPVSQP